MAGSWRQGRLVALVRGAAVVAVAALAPVGQAALAEAGSSHRASSSPGGVSYHPTAAFPHNVMSFSFTSHAGAIDVVNSSGGPRVGADYRLSVRCATFLPGGVVYWGGPVTKTGATSLNETGKWAFGYFKAGGPRLGRVAGQWAPSGTCYSAASKSLAGPSFPVVTGTISVT
jgi:hypothetical protein